MKTKNLPLRNKTVPATKTEAGTLNFSPNLKTEKPNHNQTKT